MDYLDAPQWLNSGSSMRSFSSTGLGAQLTSLLPGWGSVPPRSEEPWSKPRSLFDDVVDLEDLVPKPAVALTAELILVRIESSS